MTPYQSMWLAETISLILGFIVGYIVRGAKDNNWKDQTKEQRAERRRLDTEQNIGNRFANAIRKVYSPHVFWVESSRGVGKSGYIVRTGRTGETTPVLTATVDLTRERNKQISVDSNKAEFFYESTEECIQMAHWEILGRLGAEYGD